jgi:hypothetical protein
MTQENDIVMCSITGKPFTECDGPGCGCAHAREFNARNAGRFRAAPVAAVRPSCAPTGSAKPERQRRKKFQVSSGQVDRRDPYKDSDDERTLNASHLNLETPTLGDHQLSEAEFKALGLVDSCNAKLIRFFERPESFGKWFSRAFLKIVCGNDYINNRADDVRDYFRPKGLELDNWQISAGPDQPKSSHYRLCRIAEALHLSAEKKQELLARVEQRPG